ncbi:MAG: TRAP transporter large permease subunit [Pseudomonadota bacterium]
MELVFLALLLLLLVLALSSGFPVAFALPGSAIVTIGLAAGFGYLFEGDIDAYFAQDGPGEWLSAGVTNFRSLYWDVERDTLIAIPLFVFMGIMLQRSRIAEDLLVTMAQLFGPVPGGLGISVVFVGALLAATTGIVGATVIAMGLISLPAMLRHNYSKTLSTGTICAAGTLGQIIPPSIVLIILADQLAAAADQASTARKTLYRESTGEFTMPSELDVISASAGDMFMGAFFPGLVLVGLYMAYILVRALIRPKDAPPVPRDGAFDLRFLLKVLIALVPPLTLIFVVLGSIIAGVATVNQAGAIGAIGATIMGGYRLVAGRRDAFYPAILAMISLVGIFAVSASHDINVKNITSAEDESAILYAGIAVTGLLIAITWSMWRAYKVDKTLHGVMLETAKTTSMVFIILIGAAMLTSAFRAFGGEELVREFLTSLPGGFWTQFLVVMAVIFFLGFFLEFIEIAVVVVPIVAPILLADPGANVTAVWLGVMIGLNMQTSFLTPPFGFALFYLRGVAPAIVKTIQIYRGAAVFILLQLAGLAIVGWYPSLVTYLPNRIFLASENAPPPINPRLQQCLEDHVFAIYDTEQPALMAAIESVSKLDLDVLPEKRQKKLASDLAMAANTFNLVKEVRSRREATAAFEAEYRVLRDEVRTIEAKIRKSKAEIEELERSRSHIAREASPDNADVAAIDQALAEHKAMVESLSRSIPTAWADTRKKYEELYGAERKARLAYRNNVDAAYDGIADLQNTLAGAKGLAAFEPEVAKLIDAVKTSSPADATTALKAAEQMLSDVPASSRIKSRLSRARRALRGENPNVDKALKALSQAEERLGEELAWRVKADEALSAGLANYEAAIRDSIGLRKQSRLKQDYVEDIAWCQAEHRDISLRF